LTNHLPQPIPSFVAGPVCSGSVHYKTVIHNFMGVLECGNMHCGKALIIWVPSQVDYSPGFTSNSCVWCWPPSRNIFVGLISYTISGNCKPWSACQHVLIYVHQLSYVHNHMLFLDKAQEECISEGGRTDEWEIRQTRGWVGGSAEALAKGSRGAQVDFHAHCWADERMDRLWQAEKVGGHADRWSAGSVCQLVGRVQWAKPQQK
jgi:hypothetical protein